MWNLQWTVSWLTDDALSCVLTWGEGRGASLGPVIQELHPLNLVTSQSHHLPKPLTSGVKISLWKSWGRKNVQPIANRKPTDH